MAGVLTDLGLIVTFVLDDIVSPVITLILAEPILLLGVGVGLAMLGLRVVRRLVRAR